MSTNHQPRPHLLGTFEVESGNIYLSDPAQMLSTSPMMVAVKPGIWCASVLRSDYDDGEERCAALWCHHVEHVVLPDDPEWIDQELSASAEKGQVGFFDTKYYRDESVVKELTKFQLTGENLWYELCCFKTENEVGADVIPFGCVAQAKTYTDYCRAFSVVRDGVIVAIGYDLNVFPFVYMPELVPEEKQLFYAIRDDNAPAVAQLLTQSPDLVKQLYIFQYAQFYQREAALMELLRYGAEPREISMQYYLRTSQPEALEKLRKLLPPLDNPTAYFVFGDLAKNTNPDVALRLSKMLVDIGMPVNPPPPYFDLPPVGFSFVHEMRATHLPILEFWIEQGLDLEVLNNIGTSMDELIYMDEEVRIMLEEYIDFETIDPLRKYIGQHMRITTGQYENYFGPIVGYRDKKFDVLITLDRSFEIVSLQLDEMKPY